MNIVIIEGRLGQDPELRQTGSGTAVLNMSVATSEREKKGDNWEEHTEWHRVVVWGKSAEACAKYLSKGSRVLVRGVLRTRSWEKDGEKKYATEIKADFGAEGVTFLDSKRDSEERGGREERRGSRDDDRGKRRDSRPPARRDDRARDPEWTRGRGDSDGNKAWGMDGDDDPFDKYGGR